jgi:hypothetical protein
MLESEYNLQNLSDCDDNDSKSPILKKFRPMMGILTNSNDNDFNKKMDEQEKQSTGIDDETELEEICYLMKRRIGMPFCTNVLRIALNAREEQIASTLIANYKIALDEKMIIRALKTD